MQWVARNTYVSIVQHLHGVQPDATDIRHIYALGSRFYLKDTLAETGENQLDSQFCSLVSHIEGGIEFHYIN